MIFDLKYIRIRMNEFDKKTGFNSKDIKLEENKRLTRTFAITYMKWTSINKEERVLLNNKIEFANSILNCGLTKEQMDNIIKHEYCHAWADFGQNHSNGHTGVRFITCCKVLECTYEPIITDTEVNRLAREYFKLKVINTKTIRKLLSTQRYFSDIKTRIVKDTEICDKYLITINNKYVECNELKYVFNEGSKNIIKILKEKDYVTDLKVIERVENERVKISFKLNN